VKGPRRMRGGCHILDSGVGFLQQAWMSLRALDFVIACWVWPEPASASPIGLVDLDQRSAISSVSLSLSPTVGYIREVC